MRNDDNTLQLRILYVARPDLFSNPGGDTTQVLATKQAVEALGCIVDLQLADSGDAGFSHIVPDLVHVFNVLLSHQYESHIAQARKLSIPVLISPVYWDMESYETRARTVALWKRFALAALKPLHLPPVRDFLRRHLKTVRYNSVYRAQLREVLQTATLLLPNSQAEALLLRENFSCTTPSSIVYNPCRHREGSGAAPVNIPDEFILCVGRVERRKNQAALIRALRGTSMPLLLIGGINYAEGSYWSECLREAQSGGVDVLHIDNLAWEDVWPYYTRARLHVQPSWFETPGLSSLEAAAAGCPVVCTRVGSAPEYFGTRAEYCDPSDVRSIADAISRALTGTHDRQALADFIRTTFSVARTGEQTLQAYRRVAGRSTASERVSDAAS